MSCEQTRAQLLELPPGELTTLPHLATCPRCRALAEALVTRHADLERALAATPPMPLSLGLPEPANTPWRWTMSSIALTAAVAATLAVGARTLWTPAPTPAAPVSCDLAAMEPRAVVGKLTPEEVTCLEEVFTADPVSAANRMVIVHHYSAGDFDAWEAAAMRQVRADQARGEVDPDLAYKMAVHYAKQQDEPAKVVELAGLALDRKSVWTGKTLLSRENSLLKLVAVARHTQWDEARKAGADEGPTQARAEQAARAWLDFAVQNGMDPELPREQCQRVARDPSVCAP